MLVFSFTNIDWCEINVFSYVLPIFVCFFLCVCMLLCVHSSRFYNSASISVARRPNNHDDHKRLVIKSSWRTTVNRSRWAKGIKSKYIKSRYTFQMALAQKTVPVLLLQTEINQFFFYIHTQIRLCASARSHRIFSTDHTDKNTKMHSQLSFNSICKSWNKFSCVKLRIIAVTVNCFLGQKFLNRGHLCRYLKTQQKYIYKIRCQFKNNFCRTVFFFLFI